MVHDPTIPPITQFEVCKPPEPIPSPYHPHMSRLRKKTLSLRGTTYFHHTSRGFLSQSTQTVGVSRFYEILSHRQLSRASASRNQLPSITSPAIHWPWHCSKPYSRREPPQHAHNGELLASTFSRRRSPISKGKKALMNRSVTERTSVLLCHGQRQ